MVAYFYQFLVNGQSWGGLAWGSPLAALYEVEQRFPGLGGRVVVTPMGGKRPVFEAKL